MMSIARSHGCSLRADPLGFTDLIGHRELLSSLQGELERRPAHAYVFSGPRGIGKALVAQAVAHNFLCGRSPGPAFCGH